MPQDMPVPRSEARPRRRASRRRKHRTKSGRPNIRLAIGLVVAIAVLSVIFAARSQRPFSEPVSAVKTTYRASLRLDGALGPRFAGDVVAMQNGLFGAAGIALEIRQGGSQADPIALVENGVDTFGIAGAEKFLIARARGAPLVAFAAASTVSPVAFYSLASAHIESPADFVGKRIGIAPGEDTAIAYKAMMQQMAVSRSEVREVPVSSGIAALLSGQVDVLPGHVGVESWALERKGVEYNVLRPGTFGVHTVGSVYFATEETVRNQPALVVAFLRSVIRGWDAVYADEDGTASRLATVFSSADPAEIRFELDSERELQRPYGARFGDYDETQWQSLQAFLVAQRLLRQPLDLSQAVSYDFIREAYRESRMASETSR